MFMKLEYSHVIFLNNISDLVSIFEFWRIARKYRILRFLTRTEPAEMFEGSQCGDVLVKIYSALERY